MKLSNRQLVIGSLQPLLFCIGMYFVILIFSVFVCSSIYQAFKSNKKAAATEVKSVPVASVHQQVAVSLNK
ncbi:hypothetical protein [Agriterribacter sp.]|uniref:hypothetical protein n=1 Tax=Agriterribacter sp. TaxID=2821509 RepID=UPI002B84D012|nr:hypothetical protein [Agriterribacter sp.]HTN06902.1 hypothetical protein [Agriterribacter sp.]